MAKDFKASQVRTTQIIASGSTANKPSLLVASASSPGVNFDGGGIGNATLLDGVGKDVFVFVSGTKASKGTTVQGVALFGGDVVISGTAYNGAGSAFAVVAGSDTQVQFNDGGTTMGADSDFTYNKTSNVLNVGDSEMGSFGGSAAYFSHKDATVSTGYAVYQADPAGTANTWINAPTGGKVYISNNDDSVAYFDDNEIALTGKAATAQTVTVGSTVGASSLTLQAGTGGVTVSGNATVTGDLTVNGTTTTVNTQNLLVKDPIIYFGSGSVGSNRQGGIALASGSSEANKALVFGRVDSDTWGAGKKDVDAGETLTLADMTLVPLRASKFEVGGTGAFVSSSIGSDLRISSTNMYLTGTVAHGLNSSATGDYAVAINNSTATGDRSFAQGSGTAGGAFSIAQGENTTTYGVATHAEGSGTTAVDDAAHAEGSLTTAEGGSSHSEGYGTYAINSYSHAEGYYTTTPGAGAHSEGYITTASGDFSHSQGNRSVSLGDYSLAGGIYTIASGSGQTVLGKYNKRGNTDSLFVVGGGTGDSNSNRKDILLVNDSTVRIGSASLGSDVVFYVSGNANSSNDSTKTVIGGSLVVSGVLAGGYNPFVSLNLLAVSSSLVAVSGGTVGLEAAAADTFMYVSGAIGSKDTSTRGTAVFGGDVVISGTLHGSAIKSLQNVASAISLTTNKGSSETIVVTNTQGTSESAITLTSTAGGVDIDAAASKDVDISGGQVKISSKDDVASAISLTANQGTSETISIVNVQGTSTSAIALQTVAGGIYANAISGPITILGGSTMDLQGVGNSQLEITNGNLSLEALGDGNVILNAASTSDNSKGVIEFQKNSVKYLVVSRSLTNTSVPLATMELGITDSAFAFTSFGGDNFEGDQKFVGQDAFFIVSGAIGSKDTSTRGTAVFGGDVVISGTLHGGSPLKIGGPVIIGSASLGSDVVFYVSGNANSSNDSTKTVIGGSLVVSGVLAGGYNPFVSMNLLEVSSSLLAVRGGTVGIEAAAADTFMYVSGAIGSKDTSTRGTAVFGGDLFVSGTAYVSNSLHIGNSTLTEDGDNDLTISAGRVVFLPSETDVNAFQLVTNGAAGLRLNSGEGGVGINSGLGQFTVTSSQVVVGSSLPDTFTTPPVPGVDTFIFVSGALGSRGTSTAGAAVFGGDVVISGSLHGDDNRIFITSSIAALATDRTGLSLRQENTDASITLSGSLSNPGLFGDSITRPYITTETPNQNIAFVLKGGTNTRIEFIPDDDVKVKAFISGSGYISGTTVQAAALSGSLTKLADGTSYLIAGTNVTITTGSNGAVTIASTGGGGGGDSFFSSTTGGSIFTTGSAAFRDGEAGIDSPSDKGADVFFYVSGSSNSKNGATPGVAMFGGDVVVSGTIHGGVAFGNTYLGLSAQRITLAGNSLPQSAFTNDSNIYFSGSIGSKNTANAGTSVFGGDVVVSGTLYDGSGVAYSTGGGAVTGTFNDKSSGLVTTASVSFAGAQGAAYFASRSVGSSTGGDVFFYVSGTARQGHNPGAGFLAKRTLFNGDVVTSGTLQMLGAGYTGTIGTDTLLFVSGGIGTKGVALSRGTSVFAGDLYTSGNVYAGTISTAAGGTALYADAAGKLIFNASDERLKKDFEPILEPLSKTCALTGTYYVPRDEESIPENRQVGLIAQNVLSQVPELTVQHSDGVLGVRYEKVVALLVEAIKEQQGQIEDLKRRLSSLENS